MNKNNKNRLFEIINYLNKKDKLLKEAVEFYEDKNSDKHYFSDDDVIAYAFGYIDDKLVLSKNHGTHADAVKLFLNMNERDPNFKYFDEIYRKLKYEGRFWVTFDTISFRDINVPNHIINQLKQDLKKYFPGKDFSNINIETKHSVSYV